MVIHRGEIWWADLGEPRGSEPGFRRPVLIIQSDIFNSSRINTVLAAIITSNQQRAAAPGNVLLSRKASGLPQVSVVNVSQLVTVDKAFLSIRIRKLNSELMTEVDAGLSLVLGLP
ncbi:mRNA interferase MazF [Planctomicrobium piriforme]|uniref:mRNA interferase n=1 Tax=Planctomicrobium piriforme TaxID=1576369 RepID=A0A1I3HKM2_9PLAN|nr:type II toxin-antitoxin system PemK/MazF family toxin [Planctomicrobium piriforme]SFI36169.1 mRNA interferase MazF [Planctomicrobium piriforme]